MRPSELLFPPSPPSGELGAVYLSQAYAGLIRLRRERQDELNRLGVDLIERAIVATAVDCAENGAGEAARTLMARLSTPTDDDEDI